ncbi:hypothetical protein [Paraherbaspirillum soli]|uniref:Uncharacterized protein n=1 Tax=Paraherbaspirillum soli TaxID=631222 RepID=A0ABW0M8W7_9BURK
MSMPRRLDLPELTELAQRSDAVKQACSCAINSLAGWESMPLSLPEEQLREIGTLIHADEEELTFSEHHPDGTRYWSPEAPIAPRYFPYNRCNVWECGICGRCFLRYTECGGYFVDRRIRALNPALIFDAPL